MRMCAKCYNYVRTVSYQVQDGVYFIRTKVCTSLDNITQLIGLQRCLWYDP